MKWQLRSILAAVAIVLSMSASSRATDILPPAGLNPGDTFRFIIVSSTTVAAYNSSSASYYDSFIATDTTGYTYGGQSISWKALVSTSSVAAKDNIGGFNTSVPVYLVTGTKVANNMGTTSNGLWSSSLLAAVSRDIAGTNVGSTNVVTGTKADGTSETSGGVLGGVAPYYGKSDLTNASWLHLSYSTAGFGSPFRIYGVSNELTVAAVPEPSTWALCAIATGVLGVASYRRKR